MNQVQTALPQVKAGKVRLLAVTTQKPVAVIPDVPTIASSGLPGARGFDSSIWFAVFAPKATDPAIVNKLNAAIRTVMEQPDIRAKFESQGNTVRIESPAQFKQTVHANRLKWAEVAKVANISVD